MYYDIVEIGFVEREQDCAAIITGVHCCGWNGRGRLQNSWNHWFTEMSFLEVDTPQVIRFHIKPHKKDDGEDWWSAKKTFEEGFYCSVFGAIETMVLTIRFMVRSTHHLPCDIQTVTTGCCVCRCLHISAAAQQEITIAEKVKIRNSHLLLGSLIYCTPEFFAKAAVSCNKSSTCSDLLRNGSECIEGLCTNPFQGGCLWALLDSPEYWDEYNKATTTDAASIMLQLRGWSGS